MANKKSVPVCAECGRSVAPGSGRFVNRVPELNTRRQRRTMGRLYPQGDYLCAECNESLERLWQETMQARR